MPKAEEQALLRVARARGYNKERTGAFVYGTMRKQGWKPEREIRAKAKRIQEHKRKMRG